MNRSQKVLFFTILALLISSVAVADTTEVERYHSGSWEHDIGYTQAIRHGDMLYLSGVVSGGATMEEQVVNVYREIQRILARFGADLDDIIKEVLYTTDIEATKKAIPARKEFFKNGVYPTASWVQIKRLFDPNAMVEVEVEVMLDNDK